MGALRQGAGAFLRGLSLLANRPRWTLLVLAPSLLTALLYLPLVGAGFHGGRQLREMLVSSDAEGGLASAARTVIDAGLFVLVIVVAGLSFIGVCSLVAAPFADLLSERVERLLLGNSPAAGGTGRWLAGVLRSLGHGCVRVCVLIALVVAATPLLLVPAVGQVAFTLWWTWISIRFLAWDALEPSMARRGLPFRDKRALLRTHRARTSAYGACVFLLSLVPLAGLVALPLSALGGTVLYLELAALERDRYELRR